MDFFFMFFNYFFSVFFILLGKKIIFAPRKAKDKRPQTLDL